MMVDDDVPSGAPDHRDGPDGLQVAPLAPEERALLEILVQEWSAREGVPIPDRTIISRFERYAFPIGLDEAGTPFPVPQWVGYDDDAEAGQGDDPLPSGRA
jgi:hypothetical protein